jgi:hypothetical protein
VDNTAQQNLVNKRIEGGTPCDTPSPKVSSIEARPLKTTTWVARPEATNLLESPF